MIEDYTKPLQSSFLSVDRNMQLIMEKLFKHPQHSKKLKRLLVANTSDCLDVENSAVYSKIDNMSVAELIQGGYIRSTPKVRFNEFEQVKSYIIITMDDFVQNATNPQFRNCNIYFDVVCHIDNWDLGNFRQRPLYICGYIDGLLNKSRLVGIGELSFMGCNLTILSEDLSSYTLGYMAIHGSEDTLSDDAWLNGARK